ncbi:TubC N-terminal docking domain-related protein [Methylococcus mesophilus]|uniref:TubC N-terminal docking domain-related protein n=1 Tax=Methylococcus mesophilus TaxID=2993564 RepID=UPI00224B3E29|nr:hypothetical protein [Methylococcus mesophilus]UZR30269.1 hypothetical protein OOT43_06420 [Methylococcus mesophilus]
MNAASNLLQTLARRGVRIGISGDRLTVDAPPGILTDEDREALVRHKAGLVTALLNTNAGPANKPLPDALVRAALRLCASAPPIATAPRRNGRCWRIWRDTRRTGTSG